MRKTQEVFIGSTFTAMAAGDVNVSALAAGAMVAYDQDRDGAITTADQYFSIAQADTVFQSRSSMPIYLGQIKRVTKKAYAAATNQQTTLNSNRRSSRRRKIFAKNPRSHKNRTRQTRCTLANY